MDVLELICKSLLAPEAVAASQETMTLTHVLVPLDGSPLADEALTYALETFDCRITVLNVVAPLDTGMSEGGVLEPDADRQRPPTSGPRARRPGVAAGQ